MGADLNNQNLKLKTYEDDIKTLRSEIKDMEETMESNERIRQEIILEKQRLEETLGEVGADSDKRESELSNHQERVRELERKLSLVETSRNDKIQELQNEIEFVRSQ